MLEPTPPQGTVALIFTDVQGSTDLWEAVPDAMRAGLALHDDSMRALIAEHRGYEVKTEGDAFMVSFSDPADAVRWCLAVQETLPDLDWPPALLAARPAAEVRVDGAVVHRGLRVRMGGHLGAPDCRPDPVTGRMDYFGPVVNRAARVGGCGHGGQIVVSKTLLDAASQADATLAPLATDAGPHGLKGLARPEHLFTLAPARFARREFPPLRTLSPTRTNLGASRTSFVGRAEDAAAVRAALGDARLVTLLGPGGMGKTRLAREVGRGAAGDYAGGAWFADLTDARDLDGVVRQVGSAVAAPLADGDTPEAAAEALGAALAARGALLLVLDNFEQVTEVAPASVHRWLEAAPDLRVLVTSREALGLAGEARVDLEPLLPADALELFAQRAAEARPGFQLEGAEREAAAGLVEDLDRMPLAIELAAARVGMLPPTRLRERLGKTLDVLKARRPDAPARQRTLRAAIEWSWDLLDPAEQRALAQLSVFRGGFALEDAEAVVDPGPEAELDVLDLLESLREKSLVRDLPHPALPGEPRLGLYETIRVFAAAQLEAPADAAARARHADHFADLGDQLTGRDVDRSRLDEAKLGQLVAAGENLHAALAATEVDRPGCAARLAAALGALHALRGPAETRRRVLDQGIAAARRAEDQALEALLLLDRAGLEVQQARFEDSAASAEAASKLAEALDDPTLRAEVLCHQAMVMTYTGQTEQAEGVADQARALAKAAGNPALEAKAVSLVGGMYLQMCSWDDARVHTEEAARLFRAAGNTRLEPMPLLLLGFVRWNLGDGDVAQACYDRALDIVRRIGDRPMEAMALQWLGELQMALGLVDEARVSLEACMAVARENLLYSNETGALFTLGVVEGEAGDLEASESLCRQALARVQASGEPLMEGVLHFYLGALAARRDAIDEAEGLIATGHERVPAPFVQSEGMDLMEGWVDLARARAAAGADEAREHRQRVRERLSSLIAPDAEDPAGVDIGAAVEQVVGNKRAIVRGLWRDLQAAEAAAGGDAGAGGDGDASGAAAVPAD